MRLSRLNDVLVEITRAPDHQYPDCEQDRQRQNDFHRPLLGLAQAHACGLDHQSVSRSVAITLSLSAQRRVNSRCSRSASSSRPIHRNLRMRPTRSFALLSSSAASSCCGCLSVIGMAVLPHIFVVWLCRLSATQRSYIAIGPADRSRAALRAQIAPVSPELQL